MSLRKKIQTVFSSKCVLSKLTKCQRLWKHDTSRNLTCTRRELGPGGQGAQARKFNLIYTFKSLLTTVEKSMKNFSLKTTRSSKIGLKIYLFHMQQICDCVSCGYEKFVVKYPPWQHWCSLLNVFLAIELETKKVKFQNENKWK